MLNENCCCWCDWTIVCAMLVYFSLCICCHIRLMILSCVNCFSSVKIMKEAKFGFAAHCSKNYWKNATKTRYSVTDNVCTCCWWYEYKLLCSQYTPDSWMKYTYLPWSSSVTGTGLKGSVSHGWWWIFTTVF